MEHIIKITTNLKAVFVATAIVATVAAYAAIREPTSVTQAPGVVVTVSAPMQVIVIKGQRLSAAEKAKLGA